MHGIATLTAAAAAGGKTSAPSPRLVRAAHEFEAMMMEELMKPMTHDDMASGMNGGSDFGAAGALGDFASEAFAQALSAGGGFGIAREIIHSLSSSGTHHQTGKVTGDLHRNTAKESSK